MSAYWKLFGAEPETDSDIYDARVQEHQQNFQQRLKAFEEKAEALDKEHQEWFQDAQQKVQGIFKR